MQIRHVCEFRDILIRYAYTAHLSPSDWAWEFLRRNRRLQGNAFNRTVTPDVLAAAGQVTRLSLPRRDRLAETWGLICFPDTSRPALATDVFWSDRAYCAKIAILGRERATGEAAGLFDAGLPACRITHLSDAHSGEHVLMRTGAGVLQVRYRGLTLFAGHEVKLDVSLSNISQPGRQADILAQARRVFGQGQAGTPALTQKGLRLRNALVALDAHTAGLTYRETAMILYGEDRVSDAWHSHSAAMKSEMARLLSKGQRLRDGGYFRLMRGRRPPGRRQGGGAQGQEVPNRG